jgi:hypothetical protein
LPKKKKLLTEKTTEETIKKLFPVQVRKKVKKESHKKTPNSLLVK